MAASSIHTFYSTKDKGAEEVNNVSQDSGVEFLQREAPQFAHKSYTRKRERKKVQCQLPKMTPPN